MDAITPDARERDGGGVRRRLTVEGWRQLCAIVRQPKLRSRTGSGEVGIYFLRFIPTRLGLYIIYVCMYIYISGRVELGGFSEL